MAGEGGFSVLEARHIQNMSEATTVVSYWGYADRAMPCTNDPGSCEYLDVVYNSHRIGMLYSGILWATLGGILFLWAVGRRVWPSPRADEQLLLLPVDDEKSMPAATPARRGQRVKNSLAALIRSYLLPDAVRAVFGRTTRLQVLILTVLAGYLLIWSHVGIVYGKWVTPIEGYPNLHNIRTSLGPWSDRIGVLAYALTPLSVMLASRESVLSLLTGVPYQSFNFLHRWLGYIIVIQGTLHTIAWTIIEVKLYQPQPETARTWITQLYMIWGVVAMILLLLLFGLSTPWAIRRTGYEFFRKAHYLLAMLYIGACWGHWKQLRCFMIPSLVLWFLDRGARLIRTYLIHYQVLGSDDLSSTSMGFRPATAALTYFPDPEHGDIVRLDFAHTHAAWDIGKHFYLCFPEGSIWQSHPFTPLNLPVEKNGQVEHAYIFRAKQGETKKIAELAESGKTTTPVILQGPYGESTAEHLTPDVNMLCVAGGTGITYVLPLLLDIVRKPVTNRERKIELLWAVRRKADTQWVEGELQRIRDAAVTHGIEVHVFVTREQDSGASSLLEAGKVSSSASSSASEKGKSQVREEGKEKTGIVEEKIEPVAEPSSSGSSIKAAGGGGNCCDCGDDDEDEQKPEIEAAPIDIQKIGGGAGVIRHPDLEKLVREFVGSTVRGRTTVYASGPGGMISDLREIVAACNSGAKVWRGEERFDVGLVCDDRLEW